MHSPISHQSSHAYVSCIDTFLFFAYRMGDGKSSQTQIKLWKSSLRCADNVMFNWSSHNEWRNRQRTLRHGSLTGNFVEICLHFWCKFSGFSFVTFVCLTDTLVVIVIVVTLNSFCCRRSKTATPQFQTIDIAHMNWCRRNFFRRFKFFWFELWTRNVFCYVQIAYQCSHIFVIVCIVSWHVFFLEFDFLLEKIRFSFLTFIRIDSNSNCRSQ